MTPRLAVTQEQVDRWDVLYDGARTDRPIREVRARLPERPTMPCPECAGHGTAWVGLRECSTCGIGSGSVPIPEGTRVEVGWWAGLYLGQEDWRNEWHPVAFATLTKVKPVEGYWPDDDYWLVVLSDITVEAP